MTVLRKQLVVLTAEEIVAPRQRSIRVGEVARLSLFSGKVGQVAEFVTAYKLYIQMRLREESVEQQIQQILTYI